MSTATGGASYAHPRLEVTEAVFENSGGLDTNSRAGYQRISLEIKDMLSNGHASQLKELKQENMMLKQNLLTL